MNKVGVGVGVIIQKDGKVLLGKRLGDHGKGTWCPPGGHLEYRETFEGSARREVQEEAGISIKNIRFGAVTNDVFLEIGSNGINYQNPSSCQCKTSSKKTSTHSTQNLL